MLIYSQERIFKKLKRIFTEFCHFKQNPLHDSQSFPSDHYTAFLLFLETPGFSCSLSAIWENSWKASTAALSLYFNFHELDASSIYRLPANGSVSLVAGDRQTDGLDRKSCSICIGKLENSERSVVGSGHR